MPFSIRTNKFSNPHPVPQKQAISKPRVGLLDTSDLLARPTGTASTAQVKPSKKKGAAIRTTETGRVDHY